MKSAIKTSEESWIEQQMLEDKKRATDWEATNEAIEEQVARESYLQWLRDQEKQAKQVSVAARQGASTVCVCVGQRAGGVERPIPTATQLSLVPGTPPLPSQPNSPLVSLYPTLDCRAIMQQMSPTAFGECVQPCSLHTERERL
uniref:Clathrin light chain n=1 Tax=Callorhinchus milii TaxID=7868 RepID=A0A4W3GH41_CALMI